MNVKLTDQELIKVANSDDVFEIMQKILVRENKIDQEKEHFWMLGLNNASKILFIELVSMGSVNTTNVEPMNVFRVAVLKGAIKVIMVHNHPSGELKPSKADLETTDRLIQVGKILNIKVIDHLIITEKSYLSFGDTGRMNELEKSDKWVPDYIMIENIKKEEEQLRKAAVKEAREKAEKKKAIEIAKALKRNNVDFEVIAQSTGLTYDEIVKLK